MMPSYINPNKDLDPGIRDLVVSVARLPGSITYTNCEGHENYSPPTLPAKGGWFWFDLPEQKYEILLSEMDKLSASLRYKGEPVFLLKRFGRTTRVNLEEGMKIDSFGLIAEFEEAPYFEEDPKLFVLTENGARDLRNYLRRAKMRKPKILEGWSCLNDLVLNFIRETITPDIESLPFTDNMPTIPRRGCIMH